VRRLGIDCIKARAAIQGEIGPLALEARPVLASAPICLRCHDNRKLGDPVGAVIYAFRRPRAQEMRF